MRLFVAIEIPERERRRLVEWRAEQHWCEREGSALKWVGEENLHVTLKFLGEVPDADVANLCSALAEGQRCGPIPLHVHGLTCLPPRGRVGVIVAGISGDVERLTTLQMEIDRRLKGLGFPQERRPFRPHVTLARCRGKGRSPGLLRNSVAESSGPQGDSFHVASFVLMSSDLTSTGSVYTPIARFPLGPE